MSQKVVVSQPIQVVIDKVESVIQPVYLVGGPVRDLLLGKKTVDFDFATPLRPEEIELAIRAAGLKPYLVGKRFGTVGLKTNNEMVEITTFRTEEYESGSRKPVVTYIDDITHDLSRRDFTINAMAIRHGRLIDPFDGQQDIKNRVIRTVGQPGHRFTEDPLRLLRAIRFASQLGFAIDSQTLKAIEKRVITVLGISKERWVAELDKLLMSEKPSIGLNLLAQTRLLHVMLPELALQIGYDQNSPYHELDLWAHTCKSVDLSRPDLMLRWATLLHDVGKPFTRIENKRGASNYPYHELIGRDLVRKIGAYLRWSNDRTFTIAEIVEQHLDPDSPLRAADTGAQHAS